MRKFWSYRIPVIPFSLLFLIYGMINLTAGQILVEESFEDTRFGERGWYDNLNYTITSRYAVEGSHCLEIKFLTGSSLPTAGGAMRILFPETEVVFVRYFRKFSSQWVGTGYSYGPHEIYLLTNADSKWAGPAVTHLTIYIEPNGAISGRKQRIGFQDIANETMPHGTVAGPVVGGYNGVSYTTDEVFTDTLWHEIEVKVKLNSLDVVADSSRHDGELKLWVDGNLLINETAVILRTPDFPSMKFRQLLIGPWFHDGVPHDQEYWIDHLTISTSRIGGGDQYPKAPINLRIKP